MEIEIEHLKTNENIVIMKLKDYKNLKESTNTFYKCWREKEKRIDKAIEYIEECEEKVEHIETDILLDILKGSDTNE